MSRNRPRTFEDFVPQSYKSIDKSEFEFIVNHENSFLRKKMLREGDKRLRRTDKYEHHHLLKRIQFLFIDPQKSDESKLSAGEAIDEVRALEFLRLMTGRHPKARVYLDNGNSVYVGSKIIPNFKLIYKNESEVFKNLSFENYGSQNGLKGLGELYFLCKWVLQDLNFSSHCLGFANGELYQTEGSGAFHHVIVESFLQDIIYRLKEHPVFQREQSRLYLQLIVLPDSLIQKFVQHYNIASNTGRFSSENYFYIIRNFHRDIVFQENYFDRKHELNHFKKYVLSVQAMEDLEAFTKHLCFFFLTGKQRLLGQVGEFQTAYDTCCAIDNYFKEFRQKILKMKQEEKPKEGEEVLQQKPLFEAEPEKENKNENVATEASFVPCDQTPYQSFESLEQTTEQSETKETERLPQNTNTTKSPVFNDKNKTQKSTISSLWGALFGRNKQPPRKTKENILKKNGPSPSIP